MKTSLSWLHEWVRPELSQDSLVALLNMSGLEVDHVEPVAKPFTGVVVGEILATDPHPDADKLSVCRVTDGVDVFQVVCGALNARPGIKIPFAKVGAVLGVDFKIKKAKLRGVESHGMLCSADELGLSEDASGLLELPSSSQVGIDLRSYLELDDISIEIDLTPNRGDCLSVRGLAREIAALTSKPISEPVLNETIHATLRDVREVEIQERKACPRYLGRVIKGINLNAESPLWLKEKLRRSGVRSIDPVVDVTNLMLLELGQPMHAFDNAKLSGKISIRMAKPDEPITMIDGKELKLRTDTLVIADESGVLAMAGIMGGRPSAVSDATQDIFLEAAAFNPLAIAGIARSYGLHTDSSHRYERGVDYYQQTEAMERATALLLELVGGEAGPVVLREGELIKATPVTLRKSRCQKVLGFPLATNEILHILERLGLELINETADGWDFMPPSWRFDIQVEEDLIEEVARLHGYDRIPASKPIIPMSLRPAYETELSSRSLREAMVNLGFQEVITYSFVESELNSALSTSQTPGLALANPISQEMAEMRLTLWPGLLKTLVHNVNRQQTSLKIFEYGLSFYFKNNILKQTPKVSCLLWGEVGPEQWGQPTRLADFFDLKGNVQAILSTQDYDEWSFVAANHPALQVGQSALIERQGVAAGWIGALNPEIAKKLDIPGKVLLAELDVDILKARSVTKVRELSRFPAVRRDLALVLPMTVSATELMETISQNGSRDLKSVFIFDEYKGNNIEVGKRSLALGLHFQHGERTLTDEDINIIIENIIKVLQDKFKAELR
jgi:phenylalanyl-tRNA synthetase beta chain